MFEKLEVFLDNYQNALKVILRDYENINKGIVPILKENGLIESPIDKYKLPTMKLIVGQPTSFNKGQELPFLQEKEDKYNYYLNKVTFKDLNVFEKTKVSVNLFNKIISLINYKNIGLDIASGKSWFEENGEVCYLYIKGAISKRAKKELIKIINKLENVPIKKKISNEKVKSRVLVGKVEIVAKLKEFETQERIVSENKINKRYVGLFKTDHGEVVKGTIPKKVINLVNEEINLLINKEMIFTATFKEKSDGNVFYFSSPIKATLKN